MDSRAGTTGSRPFQYSQENVGHGVQPREKNNKGQSQNTPCPFFYGFKAEFARFSHAIGFIVEFGIVPC